MVSGHYFMMYIVGKADRTLLRRNKSIVAETIEAKMRRVMQNKEPIKDNAPLVYTERKQGVPANTNIRSDRFDMAIDAMDSIAAVKQGKRAEVIKMNQEKNDELLGVKKPEKPAEPGIGGERGNSATK